VYVLTCGFVKYAFSFPLFSVFTASNDNQNSPTKTVEVRLRCDTKTSVTLHRLEVVIKTRIGWLFAYKNDTCW